MAENTTSPTKSIISSARELIGILSAFAGILAALIYIGGRYYAYGYYSAMNIPEYMLTYSIQEYGAAAWYPVFLYTLLCVSATSLFTWIFKRFGIPWVQATFMKTSPSGEHTTNQNQTRNWLGTFFSISIFLLTLVFTFHIALHYIQESGTRNGTHVMMNNHLQVSISTNTSISLDTQNMPDQSSDIHFYEKLRLLTLNNGKYYLFKELDPLTCKPLEVFVINESDIHQINFTSAELLQNTCKK